MIMAMKTISGTYIHDVCISAGLGIVEMLDCILPLVCCISTQCTQQG